MGEFLSYAALTNVQSDDVLVVLDVHDSTMSPAGTTKHMTLSQIAGAELFKFTSASISSIANGAVITGMSYKIPAGTLSAGSSFRLVVGSPASFKCSLYADTMQGTAGTLVVPGVTNSAFAAIIDFACITSGSSGVISYSGSSTAYVSATALMASTVGTLSIDTTADWWLEIFNEQGATETFTDVFMIVTGT